MAAEVAEQPKDQSYAGTVRVFVPDSWFGLGSETENLSRPYPGGDQVDR